MKYRLTFLIWMSACTASAQVDLSDRWAPDPAWLEMTQDQAESWIYNQVLNYDDGASQYFAQPRAYGEVADTEYSAGSPSFGEYTLKDAEYCSVWPPSPTWECYRLEVHESGESMRFISAAGIVFKARKRY